MDLHPSIDTVKVKEEFSRKKLQRLFLKQQDLDATLAFHLITNKFQLLNYLSNS